jgi:L-amino acid N-acyltransferase YncA/nitrogen regulatory protein PII
VAPPVVLRTLLAEDWPAVRAIYSDGIRSGLASFETEAPSWEEWDRAHTLRVVAEQDETVVGWAAAGPISSRRCYRGVLESSVYVAAGSRGQGIGRALMRELIERSEREGVWTMQTSIFPENDASLALHAALGFRLVGIPDRQAGRAVAEHGADGATKRGDPVKKVEAVVIRERVETVIDAVEEETGHVGVTVVEAIGHGRERGITHEYRGRVFESRFLPKAVLTFVVSDEIADAVLHAIVDAARSGNESGDGLVWMSDVEHVTHNRTGTSLEEVEVG